MIDFKTLESIIINNEKFILTTHVNPDADAIGSEIALYEILNDLGKEVKIINHSDTPYNLKFLDKNNVIEKFNTGFHSKLFDKDDVLVALDFNRSDRMVSMREIFVKSKKLKLCIDHHQDQEDFVDHQFIDTAYSATGHIIYDFIKVTNIVKLNKRIAYPIYAAIMTDTGSFRFEKTTAELHKIASELLSFDITPGEVYDNIYDQSKFSKVKLLGRALASITLEGANNDIAYMILTQKDFKELDAIESDTDTFVNYNLSIQGVKIGLLFIELKDGFKVSLRSKGSIPMNKLAAEFGGGGHLNAAGVRFHNKEMKDVLPIILKKAEMYLNKNWN